MLSLNSITRLLLAICFTVVYALNVSAATLRVATYNVNWGNRRIDLILESVAEAKADVICFQETNEQMEAALAHRLSRDYPYFRAIGHKGQYAAERFVFASKYELKNLKFVPPTAGLFGFYSADANIGNVAVHLINVHLTPFVVSREGGLAKALVALSQIENKHEQEIDAIIQSIPANQPTIIVGDFNSASMFRAPQRLIEAGFVDAYAAVNADPDNDPTWSWPTKPLPLFMRIDYIFHSSHFKTTESKIIRRDGSDHWLVVAALDLRRSTP